MATRISIVNQVREVSGHKSADFEATADTPIDFPLDIDLKGALVNRIEFITEGKTRLEIERSMDSPNNPGADFIEVDFTHVGVYEAPASGTNRVSKVMIDELAEARYLRISNPSGATITKFFVQAT